MGQGLPLFLTPETLRGWDARFFYGSFVGSLGMREEKGVKIGWSGTIVNQKSKLPVERKTQDVGVWMQMWE